MKDRDITANVRAYLVANARPLDLVVDNMMVLRAFGEIEV